jgi:hypothetical protein
MVREVKIKRLPVQILSKAVQVKRTAIMRFDKNRPGQKVDDSVDGALGFNSAK